MFLDIHLPIDEIEFEPGGILYSAGDEGEALFTIRSGLVKLVQYLPDGMQRTVRLLNHGATAGLEVTLGQPYEHAAIALAADACLPNSPHGGRPSVAGDPAPASTIDGTLASSLAAGRRLADRIIDRQGNSAACPPADPSCRAGRNGDAVLTRRSRRDVGNSSEHASRTVAELKRNGAIFELSANRYRCDLDQLACTGAAEC